ncbi:MAG: DMT family transporter [Microcoleus sp. SU_5_6]|nr:DMT family transporter [Microcoleus sp. SU_5_6]
MGYLFAVIATVIWGGNFFIARAFNNDIPPVGLAFWRWAIAVITLAPFAARSTIADWKLVKKNFRYLVVSALSGITVVNTLIYIAGHTTQTINLSLIAAASPIFVVLMSRLFYGEPISLTRAAGIAVVLLGVVLLLARGSLERLLSISFTIGDLYMLLAAIIFAGYTMLVKRKPAAMQMKTFAFCTFSLGWFFFNAILPVGKFDRSPCCFHSCDRASFTLHWNSCLGSGIAGVESGNYSHRPFPCGFNLLSDSGFQRDCCMVFVGGVDRMDTSFQYVINSLRYFDC